MSSNGHVRFHNSLASRGLGVIYHLGVLVPPPPLIKTEEAVGLVGGTGLMTVGLIIKGKGGLLMALLGGVTALVSGGLAVYRMISPSGPTVKGPAVITPAAKPLIPGLPASANAYIQQLAPFAQNLIKPSTPAAPAPSAIVTSLPSYSPNTSTPAPSYSMGPDPAGEAGGGGFVTDYGDAG